MFDNRNESKPETAACEPANARKRRLKSDARRYVYVNGHKSQWLYYRGQSSIIQYEGPDPEGSGKIVRKSTGCRDPLAADAKARQWEREAADPRLRAAIYASTTTLEDAVELYFANQKRKGVRQATMDKVRKEKFGWFFKFFSENKFAHFPIGKFPICNLRSEYVLEYVDWRKQMSARRTDGKRVSDYTIKRDVQYLGYMLEHVSFLGKFNIPIASVIPMASGSVDLPGSADKRKRHPSMEAAWQIINKLPKKRRAHVAALAAGFLRLGESRTMRREDVNLTDQPVVLKTARKIDGTPWVLSSNAVLVRGTKTEGSWAEIAVTPITRPIWKFVLAKAPGKRPESLLFLPWSNPTKQIGRVCKRLGLPHVGCHDFRRAAAMWHRKQGMTPTGLAKFLRHTNDRLAQEVYGNIEDAESIAAVYLAELRPELAVKNPFTEEAPEGDVQGVCSTSDEEPREPRESHEKTLGKAREQRNGAALLSAVHGRSLETPSDPVIQPDSLSAAIASVLKVCTPVSEASEAPRNAPAQVPLVQALGVLLGFVASQGAGDEAAIVQAMAVMSGLSGITAKVEG